MCTALIGPVSIATAALSAYYKTPVLTRVPNMFLPETLWACHPVQHRNWNITNCLCQEYGRFHCINNLMGFSQLEETFTDAKRQALTMI